MDLKDLKDDVSVRLDAIEIFLDFVDRNCYSTEWCRRCDFIWWLCPCEDVATAGLKELFSHDAIEAIGRVLSE